jgi:hypothetical protein
MTDDERKPALDDWARWIKERDAMAVIQFDNELFCVDIKIAHQKFVGGSGPEDETIVWGQVRDQRYVHEDLATALRFAMHDVDAKLLMQERTWWKGRERS